VEGFRPHAPCVDSPPQRIFKQISPTTLNPQPNSFHNTPFDYSLGNTFLPVVTFSWVLHHPDVGPSPCFPSLKDSPPAVSLLKNLLRKEPATRASSVPLAGTFPRFQISAFSCFEPYPGFFASFPSSCLHPIFCIFVFPELLRDILQISLFRIPDHPWVLR